MGSLEEEVVKAVDRFDVAGLLEQLVAVPSPVGEEARLAEIMGDWLDNSGFDVVFQSVEGNRKNVVGSYAFSVPGACLMFNGHLDTVAAPAQSLRDPFRLTSQDGKLFGLGALDMKGGIAAFLAAMTALMLFRERIRGTIIFSGVIDEEAYSSGARSLLQKGLDHVDAIIIGEPFGAAEMSPIPVLTAGKVLYRLAVHGVRAHGFKPCEGVNAVEEAAQIVASLGNLRQTEHDTLGIGPVSTLRIAGGYKKYEVVVPDHCEVIISRMIVPGETSEQCKKDLEDLIDTLGLDARTTVEMIPPYYAPLVADTSCRIFREFALVHQIEFGRAACFGASNIITDASVFSGEGGIPTLVFGPSGSGIHQADEYVDVESLRACARAYARTALRFLGTTRAERRDDD